MQLGFIGLGHLGKAIAGRLLECQHTLTIWNRSADKAEGLRATVAASPAEVAQQADIVFICLFDSAAVQTVFTQDQGLLAADLNGKIIIDHTTNHFREVLAFHDLCAQAGAIYLEAPVLGSVVPASQGTLTVLVSGKEEGYSRAEPVLANVGKHLFHLPEAGLATKMKLINNLALGSFMATLAEAVAFAEGVGIKKEAVLDILHVGGGQSLVLNAKRAKLLSEDFSPHFTNSLIYKDLHCLQDLAYESKRPLFTGAVIKELFGRAMAEGMSELDFSSIYTLFKQQ
ncbi:NAD(P)-dependent oxidoreductase [uncultured Desulfobulbus sp.]|uniref:NAD(P)-dependent oxidoreductase n=1 Tax=uncultured Desulfobulbus sp. TaxID=239745 RepID=UPI0029C7D6FF|nr:NAD(P)-dependent oxidoreductase [uncultured Desulfobulbus sp.]